MEFEGAIHHVTARGVERRAIFMDDRDRLRFVRRLGEAVEECGVRLHLYCLMPNHVHLVVETPAANLSAFMHKLETAYTVYFNLRHGRAGHLMQGRFHSKLVQGDTYLLRLSRYVHLNPVCAGDLATAAFQRRRDALRRYRWSSFRGYSGLEGQQPFVVEAPVLAMAGAADGKERAAYRQYVEVGLLERDEDFAALMSEDGMAVGDEAFQAWIRERSAAVVATSSRPESLAFRRIAARMDERQILTIVAAEFGEDAARLQVRRRGCMARAVAAHLLVRHSRLTRCDVAAVLGMGSGAAVSDQLRRINDRLRHDPALASRMSSLSARLGGELARPPA
jgi:REP element-mobilizing transposase RayT